MKKHTSAGYFDVGSRQSDGRHPHVETDVVVEKEPFAGRRAILQKRFFLDADGRLGTIFVQFVAAVSVALLTLFLLPISSIFIVDRFTIFVLREEENKHSYFNSSPTLLIQIDCTLFKK